MPSLSLGKEERIYLRSELQELFASRGSFVCYPFRVIFHIIPGQKVRLKMMVSVPKRRLKHAVDRNRIKRLTREAFRLQKNTLSELIPEDQTLLVGFIYVGEGVRSFRTVTRGILEAITQLSAKYYEATPMD